jgi:hypothetical protein
VPDGYILYENQQQRIAFAVPGAEYGVAVEGGKIAPCLLNGAVNCGGENGAVIATDGLYAFAIQVDFQFFNCQKHFISD